MTKGMTPVLTEGSDDSPAERDATPKAVPSPILRYTRRLSDRIFVAFHQACDTADLDVAGQLLSVLEKMMNKRHTTNGGNRRHNMDNLIAAFERLWHLRHPKG